MLQRRVHPTAMIGCFISGYSRPRDRSLLICGGAGGGVEEWGVRRLGLRKHSSGTAFVALVVDGCANEGGEERMRLERLGFEFGVELAAEEPGVIGSFDNFDVVFVGCAAGYAQARAE